MDREPPSSFKSRPLSQGRHVGWLASWQHLNQGAVYATDAAAAMSSLVGDVGGGSAMVIFGEFDGGSILCFENEK